MINKKEKKITLENLLCLFIMICPILDVASFLFRNYFNTSLSVSTVLRPVIPAIVMICVFFKDGRKRKLQLPIIISGSIYVLYACIHLYIFKFLHTESSYGNEIRELQYLVNYTFMIMNLFIYIYVFIYRNDNNDKFIENLKKSVLISFTIYIGLMYLAIISKTSSFTYAEDKMGYKGWFESGNSIGTIMILISFLMLPLVFKKINIKVKILVIIDLILVGLYLATLLGTRTGLFGFALVVTLYGITVLFYNLFHNKKFNKRIIIISFSSFLLLSVIVVGLGSTTILRRKLLKQREDEIYDYSINESAHVTGDLLNIVNQIKNEEVDKIYMSKPVQDAIIDLYEFNNEHKIPYTNMRITQLVYHIALIKEYKSFGVILFGSGFMTHFYELIFEMEVPAFLFNFGIYGFILYFLPFLAITIYSIIFIIKNLKRVKVENIMNALALVFAISISFLAGYTFFNQSAAALITVICVLNLYEIKKLKGEKIEKNNNRDN